MRSSEQIADLAKALCAAQAQMKAAKKTEANPYFKSKYADLTNVVENDRKVLSDNGLSVVQGAGFQDGHITLTTRLMHSSGQWIEETAGAIPKDFLPQSVGATITYLRRYGYQGMVGATAEGDDDDGESAHGREGGNGKTYSPPPKAPDVSDPFEEERKYLRKAFKAIKKYAHLVPMANGMTVEGRIKQMDSEVSKSKENLPSLRHLIKKYQDEIEPYVKQAQGEAYKEWTAEFNARAEVDGVEF